MIDFDDNETYDLFMAALDKALQLSTFENRSLVRQMFRDQMKLVAKLEERVAELDKQLAEANERCADYALFATGVKNFFTEKNNE